MKRSVAEVLKLGAEYLARHGVDDAGCEAEYLVSSVLGCGRSETYLKRNELLGDKTLAVLRNILTQRASGKPSAYITGRRDFYGLEFFVDENCLIPRRETEILAHKAVETAEKTLSADGPGGHVRMLDLGCGCGNVSVAVARNVERIVVSAVDISAGAVMKTCQNALLNGVYHKITVYRGDLFSPFENTSKFASYFDIIASNPPYVADGDIGRLSKDVSVYEPPAALSGGPDGLRFYRRIIPAARFFLSARGSLLLEIGGGQKDAVLGIMYENGCRAAEVFDDYGGVPRVILGRFDSAPEK